MMNLNNISDKKRTIILIAGGVLTLAGSVISILFTPNQSKEIKKLTDRIELLEKGE